MRHISNRREVRYSKSNINVGDEYRIQLIGPKAPPFEQTFVVFFSPQQQQQEKRDSFGSDTRDSYRWLFYIFKGQ